MKNLDKYVGLDVHKDTTVIAVAEAGRTGEVRLYGTISSDLGRAPAAALQPAPLRLLSHFNCESILFLHRQLSGLWCPHSS